ncbi:hypothetical protein ACIF6L_34965 [Kitasatospora sp. NPDC086009]|uniref:hypothetical protein n=1 Tax=unclassified Kitasatospora TaxID=2633591 RepID=UPI0037C729F8
MNATPSTLLDSALQKLVHLVHDQQPIQIGPDLIHPVKVTITHKEMERSALPHVVTVQLSGRFDGTTMTNTYDLERHEWPDFVTALVTESAPTWWTGR